MTPILEARQVSKRFHGTQALRGVDFSLQAGEVHALVGENGAGKSTLAKILAGVVTPDAGEIFLAGQKVVIGHPLQARKLGIGIVFQELDLFSYLTVAENIAVANAAAGEGPIVRFRSLNSWCRRFLEQVELDIPPDTRLGRLSIGQAQRVAIARALSMNARVLLLDEPTSSLSDDAVESLFALIAQLRRNGVGFVYVSHKMAELRRIADRITVLRDGIRIGTQPANELSTDDLIAMMVGRKVNPRERPERVSGVNVLLEVEGLSTEFLSDVNFHLRAGEVLGVAGLVGAGRSELGAALFGLRHNLLGKIKLNGRAFRAAGPADAIRQGLCLLPEDRRSEGIFPQMSVRENASIAVLDRLRGPRLLQKEAERFAAFQRMLAVPNSPETAISTLSGGNQQKIILARWLMAEPSVLFLDEPTRGIDVGAKEQIYTIIDELAAQRKGIILVSSELPELWRCCDRILVLHEGRQAGIVGTADATQQEVLRLATGTEGPCQSLERI
jgi:ABC-type sugar transport system ATPase subunit